MIEGSRSTLVVYGRLAMRKARLIAARDRLQIMAFQQAAVPMSGWSG